MKSEAIYIRNDFVINQKVNLQAQDILIDGDMTGVGESEAKEVNIDGNNVEFSGKISNFFKINVFANIDVKNASNHKNSGARKNNHPCMRYD